jgi:hypothetical protein
LKGAWRYRTGAAWTTLALFLCSYCPLFAILAIRITTLWALVLAGLAIAGLVVAIGILFITPTLRSPQPARLVEQVRDRTGDVAGYVVAYLLPFLMAPTPGPRDVLAYGLFLLILAILNINSDLLYVNPLFYFFGFRVVSIRLKGDDRDSVYITREDVRTGQDLEVVRLSGLLGVQRR